MATLKEWKRDFNKLPKWQKISLIIGVLGLILAGNQTNYQKIIVNSSLNQSPICIGQNCDQNITYNINSQEAESSVGKLILSPLVENITTSKWDIEFPMTISNNYDYPIYQLQIMFSTDNKSRNVDPLEITQTPPSNFMKQSGGAVIDMNYLMIGMITNDKGRIQVLQIYLVEPHSSLTFLVKPNKIIGENPYKIYFNISSYQKEPSEILSRKINGTGFPAKFND